MPDPTTTFGYDVYICGHCHSRQQQENQRRQDETG